MSLSTRCNILFIVHMLFIFFLGSVIDAATYYVSPTGADNNNGLVDAPFRTIQKAADIVNSGDIVIVKNGIYTDTDGDNKIVNLNRGGTADKWIRFVAENKWGAVLNCQNNTTGYGWVFQSSANYVQVENFELKGCRNNGFHSNAQAHHVYIIGNNIHDIGRYCVSDTYGRSGVFQGRGTSYHTYDSNIFYTIGRLPGCGDLRHLYQHDHGIYAYGSNNTIINNIFYDLKAGWAIQISGGTGTGDGPNWNIINNTFVGANPKREGQIVIWTEKKGINPTNLTIQNNISYNSNGSFVYFYRNFSGSDYKLNNNLVYGLKTSLISYKGITANYTTSGNITGKDPLFINPENHDFHLHLDSPAIDKAHVMGAPQLDFDRNVRPYGSGFDIGAYEYLSGSNKTPVIK